MNYYSNKFIDRFDNKLEVEWSKGTWDFHLSKHPEITNFKTASGLIADALSNPSLVMLGRNIGEHQEMIRCYYKEHKRYQEEIYFTKVVVRCNKTPFRIKTVWKQWLIWERVAQETKYSNFKEIWRDQKTCL